jgi:hypothetical protein
MHARERADGAREPRAGAPVPSKSPASLRAGGTMGSRLRARICELLGVFTKRESIFHVPRSNGALIQSEA